MSQFSLIQSVAEYQIPNTPYRVCVIATSEMPGDSALIELHDGETGWTLRRVNAPRAVWRTAAATMLRAHLHAVAQESQPEVVQNMRDAFTRIAQHKPVLAPEL